MPREMSVSMLAPSPRRRLAAMMWNWRPNQKTTGVASAHCTTSYPPTAIDSTNRGSVKAAAARKVRNWCDASSV